MFGLFAEAIEDLYTGIVEDYVRRTPALWDEFAMRLPSGEFYLVDPDPYAGVPTEATSENICLDIYNNLKFSPRLCLWAVERKLADTYEKLVPGSFAEFAFNELKDYVESKAELQDNFYKHLVINTQTRTFEDPNYVNTIGSKVVIRPLAETLELSIKKNQQLQRIMVQTDPQAEVAAGDSPSGEIPEATEEPATGDSPSGEMPEADATAEVPEYLPPGKKSRTEAKEEDVEMEAREEEQPQEEDPHDEPMNAAEDAPDFGDLDINEEYEETEEAMLERANELANSEVYQHFADEENIEGEESILEQRPRQASPPQRRQEEGLPFMETEVKEEKRYGEQLEERKANDIFTQTSTSEFMEALRPEAEEQISEGQNKIELHLMAGRESYNRLHTNKISLIQDPLSKPLEPEPRVKVEVPKPQPCEDPMKVEPEYDCAWDRLSQLDKNFKDKSFGFYGKYFRQSHSRNLNFYKYRKVNPVGHPDARFEV